MKSHEAQKNVDYEPIFMIEGNIHPEVRLIIDPVRTNHSARGEYGFWSDPIYIKQTRYIVCRRALKCV